MHCIVVVAAVQGCGMYRYDNSVAVYNSYYCSPSSVSLRLKSALLVVREGLVFSVASTPDRTGVSLEQKWEQYGDTLIYYSCYRSTTKKQFPPHAASKTRRPELRALHAEQMQRRGHSTQCTA